MTETVDWEEEVELHLGGGGGLAIKLMHMEI